MGTAAMMALLNIVAPGLLGGSLGVVLGILQTPGAGVVMKIGKKMARGEHLSEEDKAYAKAYNDTSHLTKSQAAYVGIHGRWH